MVTIIFFTMGESLTEKALQAIKEHTNVPHNLLVWNNGESSLNFQKMLLKYTPNVINCTLNQGLNEAFNYALITSPDEFIVWHGAGIISKPGYLDTLLKPFEDPKVGIVGEYQGHLDDYKECGINDIPEGVDVYRKAMIDDIGACCPSFKVWGTATFELKIRALKKGWKVIGTPSVAEHINDDSEGKNKMPKQFFNSIRVYNNFVFRVIAEEDFIYDWWRSDMVTKFNGSIGPEEMLF